VQASYLENRFRFRIEAVAGDVSSFKVRRPNKKDRGRISMQSRGLLYAA